MGKFEYKKVILGVEDNSEIIDCCNENGAEGWEAFAVRFMYETKWAVYYELYFKRKM